MGEFPACWQAIVEPGTRVKEPLKAIAEAA